MRHGLLPGERAVRRRGSRQQGEALETLGHAVEYLMDSRVFLPDQAGADANREAVRLLMRASRSVFLECPEIVPAHRRVGRWFSTGVARVLRQA